MSYTASKAQSGTLALFSIGSVALPSSPTYTPIYEVNSFTQSGKTNKTADVTNLQSTGEEFISTLLSPGTFDLTCNRVSSDPGQIAVLASFNGKTTLAYKILLPQTTAQVSVGDAYTFNAIVEEMDDLSDVAPAKQVIMKCKLKVSGSITFAAGS